MTPNVAIGMYRRQIQRHGELVTLRRINTSPTPPTDVTVKARVKGFTPAELTGDIQQGDRHVIVMAEDLAAFPLPFKTGGLDKIVLRGRSLNIQSVDDSTARIGDTLIAYHITAKG